MPPRGLCLKDIMEARRHRRDGRGSLVDPQMFLDQDYQQLKKLFRRRKARLIDDMFPPDDTSIGQGLLSPPNLARVVWTRPGKIVPNPKFIVDGISRFDFGQGHFLGNCWLLASIGALTFQKDILKQVVPPEQSFDKEYCGLFHFRFWRFGKWVDVIIDDKLPTIDGKLIFVHSKTPNEFWPALLEKAYAKVCGSYADMNSGTPAEALVDFTGGIHICVQLKEQTPPDLFTLMQRAGHYRSLMGCGTPPGDSSANTVSSNGVVDGHAYTVTGIKQMMSGRDTVVDLVRLLNPWGEGEWKGDWSDGSPLWQTVSSQDRECHTARDDGEFWMTVEDFCKYFAHLDICCLRPEFLDADPSCHWKPSFYHGRWVAGLTSGGCLNHPESFWSNPQFRIKIDSLPGESEEKQGDDNNNNTLVSLMQKPDKRNRLLVKSLYIGFSVFEVTEEFRGKRGKFPAYFFRFRTPVAQSKNYMNAREVMERFQLKPGEYVIVPSTFRPNQTASFILSILTKAETHVIENVDEFEDIQVGSVPRDNYDTVDGHHDVDGDSDDDVDGVHDVDGDGHDDVDGVHDVDGDDDDDGYDDGNEQVLFRQYYDQHEEVDAEKLQQVLNKEILQGDLKGDGFSLDGCRSMVALMGTSITGKLNRDEFVRLWRKVTMYKAIFFKTAVSQTGSLLLTELPNAIMAAGVSVSDDMVKLMAVRYGAPSGHMSLDRFISLTLRLDCMSEIFRQLSVGTNMSLEESEWMYISMYT